MQANAAIPEVMIPTIISLHCTCNVPFARSKSFIKLAPAIAGIAIMNEILDAASRLKPRKRAAVMVTPEREAPGMSAKICVAPIMIAVNRVNSWCSCFLLPKISAESSNGANNRLLIIMTCSALRFISIQSRPIRPVIRSGTLPISKQ